MADPVDINEARENREHDGTDLGDTLEAIDAVRRGIKAGVVTEVVLVARTTETPPLCLAASKSSGHSVEMLGLISVAQHRVASALGRDR